MNSETESLFINDDYFTPIDNFSNASQSEFDSPADNEQSSRPTEIPSPLRSPNFHTFDDLFDFLQDFYRNNGAALIKKAATKKRDIDGTSRLRYVTLACDRCAAKDIYNDRQRLRSQLLGGLTATQAWISILRSHGLRHFIKYEDDDEHRIQGIFWTYPWCEIQWKRFPEVLGLDNTCKTNRFKMPFFQVTGISDQRSVVNFAFGLIDNEKEDAYLWLCRQLDACRRDLHLPAPSVIITDKEKALKNALNQVFPTTQQQLCVWHINANVRAKIRSRWNADDPDDLEDDDSEADDAPETANVASSSLNDLQEQEPTLAHLALQSALPEDDPHSRQGMFEAWKRVVYAPTEADFEA
ncbi:hypothetical protein MRS44_018463 [Fusarium solani]|uniref:uncharacterized protein n=1 Tax=Fusarium solani TaxID=169388 RepID=UPI0032C46520|nr:hypothetical protein MRS44_018463 [Fusarium solani]